ncbi:hypothetical protein METBIDRAFT_118136 [Metschnikowia bicuspidata var. bicuspidata NRRL YB-4993]|uniref:Uncharacterized protein n=1 Tax=Metschnikowia bicuspidata var. bicuspidata NRRL YB-4993 TaxID=869754 RepID=A0A1A0HJE6_9ASCO|nr:hypothetical protein METBIDRAFT_118136 [Metschnikowia bicuspidata var. bicuspidata NRRL YB-4993]OBA24121.1 hypothetical protein METBIDRAFT_118136 [Metschnikowia bicuspidata var. bicuspidata NRRL YB-4993]
MLIIRLALKLGVAFKTFPPSPVPLILYTTPVSFLSSCSLLHFPLFSHLAFKFASLLFWRAETVSLTSCFLSLHSISLLSFCFSYSFNAFFQNFSAFLILTPSAWLIKLLHFSPYFLFGR